MHFDRPPPCPRCQAPRRSTAAAGQKPALLDALPKKDAVPRSGIDVALLSGMLFRGLWLRFTRVSLWSSTLEVAKKATALRF